MEALSKGPVDDYANSCRELARKSGTLITPGEYAELTGSATVELSVITYRFRRGGLVPAPVDAVVRCLPGDLNGVYRSMAKLCESRHWSSEARTRNVKVPHGELELFLRDERSGI